MINIEVNGRTVTAEPGEMLLPVLRRQGIKIPTLCHVPGLSPSGACRLCVVEVAGQRNLVPSCAFPVADGMKVQTHSPRAIQARKTIIELLLADHPEDCNFCVRNGNCELQELAGELGVRVHRYGDYASGHHLDLSSPSIIRDPGKCILCGRCVRVCDEVQGIACIDFSGRGSKTQVTTAFNQGINISSCITCGQCVMACPTGALREQSHIKQVMDAIVDPDRVVVVQHAPAVSVSLAEEFDMPMGEEIAGIMTAALRRLGFDYVFPTSFSADLTIMEEASELIHRIQNGGKLPMFTSCSPGWIRFVEEFYPEFIPNLSTCKSPQQMMGAIIKTYFAERKQIDPSKIFSVAIMPCTAKKFEAGRPEMLRDGTADIDAVLTTRELGRLIRRFGLDLNSMEPEHSDTPFGTRSSAGKIFGASGGVMEAALRTAYHMLTGHDLSVSDIPQLRGKAGMKTTELEINGLKVGVAVCNGINNARKLLEEIKAGRSDLHFIEVMTCPGGCIGGGGQPYNADEEHIRARMQALYRIDQHAQLRNSHDNPDVRRLYEEYLGKPLGERSHHLLHTHYHAQSVLV
jgi:iron-only hydrogenase group A